MEFAPFQRPKGQPLLVFATVIGGWLVLRVLLWEPPFGSAAPAPTTADRRTGFASTVRTAKAHAGTVTAAPRQRSAAPLSARLAQVRNLAAASPASVPPLERSEPIVPAFTDHSEHASEHAAAVLAKEPDAGWSPRFEVRPHSSQSRWSGDAWLLLRKDSAAPLVSSRPAYGRSQAGAVLRYRIGAVRGHRPAVYLRATRALAGPAEREVAAGASARPLPRLPVSLAAEVRVHEHASGSETRAAAFAATELPPLPLPLGFRGELYAQAGYVGGRFATAFADGQLRVDSAVAGGAAGTALRLGGAISGGVQKHAGRLDIGPSALVSIPLGGAHARLALDYRLRIAGDAEPGNGPALTFSAGF